MLLISGFLGQDWVFGFVKPVSVFNSGLDYIHAQQVLWKSVGLCGGCMVEGFT